MSIRQSLTARAEFPRWLILVAMLVSIFLVSMGGVFYTNHVDQKRQVAVQRLDRQREASEREADRRWCQLLNTLDEAYSAVPPATELGRRVALAIHTLRVDLDC